MSILRAAMAALIVVAHGAAAQTDVERLQQLVETAARRVAIAEQVALAKWDAHLPVEDVAREAQVVDAAVKEGRATGLDDAFVSTFFRAQIDASKLVQAELLADWQRRGKAPNHQPIDLARTIRPELDRLDRTLIVNLTEISAIRSHTSCRADVVQAIADHLAAHKNRVSPIVARALERAMLPACD